MAKQDHSTDVGMWAVQPTGPGTQDQLLDSLVPHFEKIWDGHSCPAKRACNVLMTYGSSNTWGYTDPVRAKRNAYAFGEWLLRIKEANASSGGAGAPRYLAGIVFRALWNLTYVQGETRWNPGEIRDMAVYLLDYFDGSGSSLPQNKGSRLNRADLPLLRGYLLGDDFANQSHNRYWDQIVEYVHHEQQQRSINRPFYFSHQILDGRIWNNGAPYGRRLDDLRQWLDVFNSTGATPVFLPQFYPWEGGQWDHHDERDPYVWWDVVLDELLYLKNNNYPSLRVQPVIQAFAGNRAGPGHPDIHNQLRAVFNHSVVDGVWLLNWNFGYTWTCYKPGDNRWTAKQNIAEAIQVEVGGAPEGLITSTPSSGLTGASPSTFTRQSRRNRGPGGTRLEFNLNTRQSIRLAISGARGRYQLDGYTWAGRHYSFDGPWNKAQYTRDPRLRPNAASLNPMHGTSLNWNGWDEEDTGEVPPGNYTVRLVRASGGSLGNSINVTAR